MSNLIHRVEMQLAKRSYIGLLLLRLFIGTRLIYGVVDNVFSWEHMERFAGFLQSYGFPFPLASAIISVYVQLVSGLLLLVGYKVRLASFVLVVNFTVAVVFVHILSQDSVEGTTPALAMLFGAGTLMFTGAGRLRLFHKNQST